MVIVYFFVFLAFFFMRNTMQSPSVFYSHIFCLHFFLLLCCFNFQFYVNCLFSLAHVYCSLFLLFIEAVFNNDSIIISCFCHRFPFCILFHQLSPSMSCKLNLPVYVSIAFNTPYGYVEKNKELDEFTQTGKLLQSSLI